MKGIRKTTHNPRARSCALVLVIFGVLCVGKTTGYSQTPDIPPTLPPATQAVELADEVSEPLTGTALEVHLKQQFDLLDSPQFRTRELAEWRIRQYPEAAIEYINKSAPNASLNSASQQVALLDRFLSHPNTAIKNAAYDTLKKFSLVQSSALASLAASSVNVIEDEFERQAFEILSQAGASIGYLDINVNGSKRLTRDDVGLELKPSNYRGKRELLTWIRYLKSVRTVSLEGEFASPEVLGLVVQMANVKKILLRGTRTGAGVYETMLKPSDLLVLKQLPEIQHLEFKYISIDDSYIPALCQLPITESLRLFGTSITERGKSEIAAKLDGLEIYRGNGGFLGIGSEQIGPVRVTSVQENSAAENAGIEIGDTITEIQGNPIKNFAGLRATLANYAPNEMLLIKLKRPKNPMAQKAGEFFELQLFVVLNEQAN